MGFRNRTAILSCAVLALSAGTAAAAPTVTDFQATPTTSISPQGIASYSGGLVFGLSNSCNMSCGLGTATTAGIVTAHPGTLTAPTADVAVADGYEWLTEPSSNRIVRVDLSGSGPTYPAVEFPLSSNAQPEGIAADTLGNLWFTEAGAANAIGRITPTGTITTYAIGAAPNHAATDIALGPDGNMWFTEAGPGPAGPGAIGRITPTGTITQYTTGLTPNSAPTGITAGPDGNMWFTESGNPGAIGKINPATGAITRYTTGLTPSSAPTGIAAGPAGDVWFTEAASPGAIGWITPQGVIGQVATPTVNGQPNGITQGPDGNEWFTEDAGSGHIGRLTVPAPTAATGGASAVTTTTATLTATVNPNGFATTDHFAYGPTTAYGQTAPAPDAAAGSGSSAQPVTQTLTGLTPGTTYHYSVVASNCGGCATGTATGPDMTFTTASQPTAPAPPAAPAAPPAAVLDHTAVVASVRGRVLVRAPHGHGLRSLTAGETIPIGSLIDTNRGRVVLTTEINRRGRMQSASAWGGTFRLHQTAARGMTTFRLVGGPTDCAAPSRRSHAVAPHAARRKPVNLWAHDHDGRYSTRGNNSVATVQGTWWETTESCRGTRTYVKRGIVSVLDLHTHRTVLVHAGHSFLARP